ncbi:phage holin family protein [Acetobacteraceae bacterium H6797]|nr:phage holin family protein [Acetobacteraceae bacterium H6797]
MLAAIGAIALFSLPFLLYVILRRYLPAWNPPVWLLVLSVAGVLLAVGGSVWYGQDRGMRPGSNYVPARIGPDGRLVPGHVASEEEKTTR